MKDWQSQTHEKSECKFHIVLLPKSKLKKGGEFKERPRISIVVMVELLTSKSRHRSAQTRYLSG